MELENKNGVAPDQWTPTPTPDGWTPTPDGWTPAPADQAPAGTPDWNEPSWTPAPDQAWDKPSWDQSGKVDPKNYDSVIANVWQDAINQMMSQYDQVVEILQDPEQLKNLSKEQVMQLYEARDKLQDNLSQIIPVLEQSKNTKLEESVKDIENPKVKDYIMQFKDEFDDPEEFSALVEFAKWLMWLVWWQATPAWWESAPADLKQVMWWPQQPWTDFDVNKAMLSTDPAEREKARQFMDGMFKSVETK